MMFYSVPRLVRDIEARFRFYKESLSGKPAAGPECGDRNNAAEFLCRTLDLQKAHWTRSVFR